MKVEVIPYGGWQECLRVANTEVELVVTAEVGPRVIRFGFIGGANEFVEYPEQMGLTGGDEYRAYGGHRLWIAPEVVERTKHPDNLPVQWAQEGEGLRVTAPVEAGTGIQKSMRIWLNPKRNHVHVIHRITNHNIWEVTLAPWALTVMAPGGRVIVPQEPYRPHPDFLLPVRPLVLWGYTDMSDPRWRWGKRYVQLRQDSTAQYPQKFGALNTLGWAAYVNGDRVFLKRFPYDPQAHYPDFGCNCEFFTNNRMLEVESLGGLVTLRPGESVTHEEHWYLWRGVQVGESDEQIDAVLPALLAQTQQA
jgi:hypothetical protein